MAYIIRSYDLKKVYKKYKMGKIPCGARHNAARRKGLCFFVKKKIMIYNFFKFLVPSKISLKRFYYINKNLIKLICAIEKLKRHADIIDQCLRPKYRLRGATFRE